MYDTEILRGDMFYVDFGDGFGSEQGGVRPCVVVQNNIGNHYSQTIIVCPITTKKKKFGVTHVEVFGLPKESIVLCEQIRVVDRSRFREKLTFVDERTMEKINKTLLISMGLHDKYN